MGRWRHPGRTGRPQRTDRPRQQVTAGSISASPTTTPSRWTRRAEIHDKALMELDERADGSVPVFPGPRTDSSVLPSMSQEPEHQWAFVARPGRRSVEPVEHDVPNPFRLVVGNIVQFTAP